MAKLNEYEQTLSKVPLFSLCDKKELQAIGKRATPLQFEPGRELTRQDRVGYEFFVILSGTAKVTRNDQKITTLGPGDFFGELALLDQGPRTATVTVEEPMEALVIDTREFRTLLEEAPHVMHNVLAGLGQRIRELDAELY